MGKWAHHRGEPFYSRVIYRLRNLLRGGSLLGREGRMEGSEHGIGNHPPCSIFPDSERFSIGDISSKGCGLLLLSNKGMMEIGERWGREPK